jgi:hypothetical protein
VSFPDDGLEQGVDCLSHCMLNESKVLITFVP